MAIACSCFGLRDADLVDVIRGGAASVDEVTDACDAGGSCGSCVGTIETLLHVERALDAAGIVSAA